MSTAAERHVLTPAPPVRALVIAAVLTLAGALLVALTANGRAATPFVVLSALVLAIGLALAVAAVGLMVRMRSVVEFDDEGYRISGAGEGGQGRWADVTRVTTQAGGSHLVLHHGDERRTHLVCPMGGDDPRMQRLVADLSRHLDASRGYGETMHIPLIDPHQPADPGVVS